MQKTITQPAYSERYYDSQYEYRHVILPESVAKTIPHNRLLSENEWRSLNITMSRGWVHYAFYKPEPYVLLFRRPLGTDPLTGNVNPIKAKEMHDKICKELEISA
ncbi:hypothetical protein WA158_000289 [Blastocystis sp. Blastoise]